MKNQPISAITSTSSDFTCLNCWGKAVYVGDKTYHCPHCSYLWERLRDNLFYLPNSNSDPVPMFLQVPFGTLAIFKELPL